MIDAGTTSLASGEAAWWQVEVYDQTAQCLADPYPGAPACALLWPSSNLAMGGASVYASELPPRVYAIDTDGGTMLGLSKFYEDTDEADAAEWTASVEEMISTLTFQ